MKAWEEVRKITDEAIPVRLAEEDQTWDAYNEVERQIDFMLKLYWNSHVPGSYAPESLALASIQAVENQGRMVEGGMDLYYAGQQAVKDDDMVALNRITALLKNLVGEREKGSGPSVLEDEVV